MNKFLHKYQHIFFTAILFLFVGYFCTIKTLFTRNFFGESIGDINYFTYYILKHDAGLVGLCLLIYFCTLFMRVFLLRSLLRFVIVGIVFIYIVDYHVFRYFVVRLSTEDVLTYAPYAPKFFAYLFTSVFSLLDKLLFIVCTGVFIAASVQFMIAKFSPTKKYRGAVAISVCLLLGFYFAPEQREYIHMWAYQNVLEYNANRTANRPYSDDYIDELLNKEKDINKETCVAKPQGQKNIVVVLLESFSPYHSAYFSGLNDVTPQLDRIAKENQSFHDFYANGFNSEHALISIILGALPVPAADQSIYADKKVAFDRFYNFPGSLPEHLKSNGYDAEFLTTGDLSFSDKGNWLKSTGFQYIEGHEHPFYDEGWPRYHFESAPDEALYLRVLDRMFNVKRDRPYFLMLETVSTHHPYRDPRDGSPSEFGAVEYADIYLGKFYDTLKKRNFFDDGILIIVGDHHSMIPIKKEERELFGDRAQSLVPMIVVDGTFAPQKIQTQFQQLDVYSSVLNYVSNQKCTSLWQGDFLNGSLDNPEYVLFLSGSTRDIVEVYHHDQAGRVKMNGDQTDLTPVDFPQRGLIVDKVNYERIRKY